MTTHKVRYLHAPSDGYRTGYEGEDFEAALRNGREWMAMKGIGDVHIVTTEVTAITLLETGWEKR